MKFTFKTEKPTGKWRSFDTPTHYIKLNGKQVGTISHSPAHIISLSVVKSDINEDGNPNCVFKNIRLKESHSTLEDAKKYLNDNFNDIIKLNLYQLD